jgi:hypothetical protein
VAPVAEKAATDKHCLRNKKKPGFSGLFSLRKSLNLSEGPQEMFLSGALKQVARITGRRVLTFPFPVFGHRILAWIFKRTMTIPLISSAQVFMLSETMVEPLPKCSELPKDLTPTIRFKDEQLIDRLPEAKPFGRNDFHCFAGKP